MRAVARLACASGTWSREAARRRGLRCYKWSLSNPRENPARCGASRRKDRAPMLRAQLLCIRSILLILAFCQPRFLLCDAVFETSQGHKDLVAHRSRMSTQLSPPRLIGFGTSFMLVFFVVVDIVSVF
uniref:Uncharacterized protein n=1 Tax=Physcomitrium patens TaxID=3218 RepID=A0A2K1K000_PHYPA|nr:hypothetical protein PHYPA_014223 [Physcomitrium patens]